MNDSRHSIDTAPGKVTVSLPSQNGCDSRHETTVIVLPGPLLPPEPRVLEREARDVAFMSPEILREKLRRAGYVKPVLPPLEQCLVDGCPNLTAHGVCPDCVDGIEQGAFDQVTADQRVADDVRSVLWSLLPWVAGLMALVGLVWWCR